MSEAPGLAAVLAGAGILTCASLLAWLWAGALRDLAAADRPGARRRGGSPKADADAFASPKTGLEAFVALVRALADSAPPAATSGSSSDETRALALDLAQRLGRSDEEIEALRASLEREPPEAASFASPRAAIDRIRALLSGGGPAGLSSSGAGAAPPDEGGSESRLLFVSFDREIHAAERRGVPLSLIDLRVEGFESIEERFGRAATDRILRGVARAIRSQLRPGDTCVRDAGGSFLILAPGVAAEGVAALAARIEAAVARHQFAPERGRTVRLEASACPATLPRDGRSYDALITAARSRRAARQPSTSSGGQGLPKGLRPYPNRIDAPVN